MWSDDDSRMAEKYCRAIEQGNRPIVVNRYDDDGESMVVMREEDLDALVASNHNAVDAIEGQRRELARWRRLSWICAVIYFVTGAVGVVMAVLK